MASVVLLILDGWGQSSAWAGNILNHLNTPSFHQLIRSYFHTPLTVFPEEASDWAVNNAAFPYSMIGTGRLMQDIGDQLSQFFASNQQVEHLGFNQIFQNIRGNLHIVGLLDATGTHCRPDHLAALAKTAYAHKIREVFFHLGVQSDPSSQERAYAQATALNQELAVWGGAHVVSLFGAKSILDAKARTRNLKQILNLLTQGESWHYRGSLSFLFEKYYSRGLKDRDFPPSSLKIKDQVVGRIKSGDTVIIASLKPESGRPLVKILDSPELLGLSRNKMQLNLISLVDYGMKSRAKIIFPFKPVENSLGEILGQYKKKVFKLGPESRRFELGYYFNGGKSEEAVGGIHQFYQPPKPDRDILLGADKAVSQFYRQLEKNGFDLGILSLPNADVLARVANVEEIEEGVRMLDSLIGQLAEKVSAKGDSLIVTASFGNAEAVINSTTGERHSTHTRSPVPFVLVDRRISSSVRSPLPLEGVIPSIDQVHTLADIAPTILNLMNIQKPVQMTGQSLVEKV
jgi:2,3-bisphosphoglycerate-independent phosphoglycerate mutase